MAGDGTRRAVWTLGDQALSSISNAALSLVLARLVSAESYGAFALTFTLFTFFLGVSQSLTSAVYVVRYSFTGGAVGLEAARGASAAALGFAACVIPLLILSAVLVDAPLRQTLLALAVVLPALLLQDFYRTALVSSGRPRAAFTIDALSSVVAVAGIVVLEVQDLMTSWTYLLAWGSGASAAALGGVSRTHAPPFFRGARAWLRAHGRSGLSLAIQWIAVLGATQVSLITLAARTDLTVVGGLRAAQTLLGPMSTLFVGLAAWVVPELIRRRSRGSTLLRQALVLSCVTSACTALWSILLLLLPDATGVAMLGETWTNARLALPGYVVFTLALATSQGPSAALRIIDRVEQGLLPSLCFGVLLIILPILGASIAGIAGAAYGFGAAAVLSAPFYWLAYLRVSPAGVSTP